MKSWRRAEPIALIGALSFSGCVYFNTFYNARVHFDKAETIRDQSVQSEGVSASAIREYDEAIERCNKVIQRHSDSRWVDDAILLMGRSYFGKQQYLDAIDKFRALANSFPDSPLRDDAMFWLTLSYYRMSRYEEGENAFAALQSAYPSFERRDEILLTQAETLELLGKRREAIAIYDRIVREFPESRERVSALFKIGELYMEESVYDSAYAAYDEAMQIAGDLRVRLDARERRADALRREERYGEALAAYREVLDLGTELDSDRKADVSLKIADCLYQVGETDAAISDYERIRETMAGTRFATEATFRIGFIHEVGLRDYARAIEIYDEVATDRGAGAQTVYVEQARNRAKFLRRVTEEGVAGPADGDTSPEARRAFLLAEQYLFQESDTTRALSQYEQVIADHPDEPVAANAAYALAHLVAVTNRDSAAVLFREVLARYPNTPQALGAGDFLKRHGWTEGIPEGALDATGGDAPASSPGAPAGR